MVIIAKPNEGYGGIGTVAPMAMTSLIDPLKASDVGGVAGRRGQKFQDHVAAGFFIDMLTDARLVQVECETADDVTLRWDLPGGETNEYVQVKTNEEEFKWSVGELVGRSPASVVGTSIAEKSLACDCHPQAALFRLVSTRELRGNLAILKVRRDKRPSIQAAFDALAKSFKAKLGTFTSPNSLGIEEWVNRLEWDVEGTIASLSHRNKSKLLQSANEEGKRPAYQELEAVYASLLNLVIDAGDASRVTSPDAKAFSRAQARTWWDKQLAVLDKAARSGVKVYNVKTSEFFASLSSSTDPASAQSMDAYDAQFDDGIWRRDELADYLLDWIPEASLSPQVLAEFSHLEARSLLAKAVAAFENQSAIDVSRLISELMLHAILRHYHKSEPIGCKLFYKSKGALEAVSAHIVVKPDGDQLWMGQTRIATATTRNQVLSELEKALTVSMQREVLRAERNTIIQLRHPEHLRPNSLDKTFSNYGKVDDILSVINVPVLIAYDSEALSSGYSDDYAITLRSEVGEIYEEVRRTCLAPVSKVRAHVFLIPVECATALTAAFETKLRAGI